MWSQRFQHTGNKFLRQSDAHCSCACSFPFRNFEIGANTWDKWIEHFCKFFQAAATHVRLHIEQCMFFSILKCVWTGEATATHIQLHTEHFLFNFSRCALNIGLVMSNPTSLSRLIYIQYLQYTLFNICNTCTIHIQYIQQIQYTCTYMRRCRMNRNKGAKIHLFVLAMKMWFLYLLGFNTIVRNQIIQKK